MAPKIKQLTTLIPLLAVACATHPQQVSRTPAGPPTILVEAAFEPSWFERGAWALTVLSDGNVKATGRTLAKPCHRLERTKQIDIERRAQELTSSLDPGSYTSTVEDADAIRLKVTIGASTFDYRIEHPRSIGCSSTFQDLVQLWDLLLLACAPNASCNGVSCLICAPPPLG